MKANSIGQQSTSTGTGDFTLGAVWKNSSTFNSWFGLNHRFEYTIRNDNGEWEKGIGYLSNSTTLIRETVIDTHLRTPTLITFGAGTKGVLCATDAGDGTAALVRPDAPIVSLNSLGATAATVALAANRPRLSAFWLPRPIQCNEIGLRVTTASAGSTTRIAIYQLTAASSSGYTFTLLDDCGTVDTSTTGEKNITYTRKLGKGVYFTTAISSATPTVQAYPAGVGEVGVALLNGTASGASFDYGSTLAGSAAAAPLSMLVANPTANATSPRIHFKGAWL